MTIFRRKHVASLFSSLRRGAKKSSLSPSPPSEAMSSSQALPRQKKVYDFTAYFADQELDHMSDDIIIETDDISLDGRGVVDDDHDEEVSSVTVEPDDTGSFVMTVVHRCDHHHQQHNHHQGDETVQVQSPSDVCAMDNVRQDCVQFCERKITALKVQH